MDARSGSWLLAEEPVLYFALPGYFPTRNGQPGASFQPFTRPW